MSISLSNSPETSDFDTIFLDQDDERGNFTIVPNALIRDSTISPNARWLIIYLISNKSDWTIKTADLWKHTKGFIGRDKIRKVINECIDAGYMAKQEIRRQTVKGNLRGFKYFVSSTKKFKKCLRKPEFQSPDFQETDFQGPDGQSTLKDYKSITLSKEHNTSLKVPEEPAPMGAMSAKADEIDDSPPIKKINLNKSPEVLKLAMAMLAEMRAVKPDYKEPPATGAIETQIDLMIRRDQRKIEEVLDVFRWALSDDFWRDKMFKPNPAKYLRDKYDQLQMRMMTRLPERSKVKRSNQMPDGKTKHKNEMDDILQ